MWLQGRLKYVATTNSDQLALVNAYNGWMHSQFTKAYADSHCLHMASLLMIKGLFCVCCFTVCMCVSFLLYVLCAIACSMSSVMCNIFT